MKSRDVTIFDGYTVSTTTGTGSIPISGFKAILAGQVNMKLGIIASEGDVSLLAISCRCNKKIPLPILICLTLET
jgi:hypothetical protein